MTECKKIFLDTAPIIYFLDEDVNFGNKVESVLSELIENEIELATSTITCMEYLIYPYKMGNTEKINAFFDFIVDCYIPLYFIDEEVAKKAAGIRAEYKTFKAMDASQLATACVTGCDLFLTNDRQLRQFRSLSALWWKNWGKNIPKIILKAKRKGYVTKECRKILLNACPIFDIDGID